LSTYGSAFALSRPPRCRCPNHRHAATVIVVVHGSPLVLSRVHWVRPEMVVEVSYAEWTPDGLLRHVVYLGERKDKPASERSAAPSGELDQPLRAAVGALPHPPREKQYGHGVRHREQ
jgi:bifunctional non-homologous end joining protein LigD